MICNTNIKKILYGGDYNPEQWTPEVWDEDMRILKLAGVDIVTLNVFNWAKLQPDEITYNFQDLDKIVQLVTDNDMNICMATSTGAHPAWMARKYPDILRVEFNGMKRKFGGRHNSCPNSPSFQNFANNLVDRLVHHYKNQKNIVAWHVSNEYGGECYCENCEKAFRLWLKEKYKSLDNLNYAWNTAFWGHTFYSWEDIVAPNLLSECFGERRTMQQGMSLDYARFNSDSMLNNYKAEYKIIKEHMPDIPVTTNFMGQYKQLDYQRWAPYLDFISWDSYPSNDTPIAYSAMCHDTMRGLKNGQPFILMEQTPSVSNWLSYCALKRPGIMRLWSYQAVAHGSNAVMFFQMRRSPGACEKLHGGIIDHVGHEHTRVFREIAKLGKELDKIGDKLLDTRLSAKAAILFDWNNWWAIENSAGPTINLKYQEEVFLYYQALYEQNIAVDIIGVDADLKNYSLVIAPLLYMVKPGFDKRLEEYVEDGGELITTFFSGYADENDRITLGGYPGKLKKLLGIWVEEIDALPENMANSFIYEGREYPAKLLCDILHCETAECISTYKQDFYADFPVLTKNLYGKGAAYYVAARSDKEFYREFLNNICTKLEILPVMDIPAGIEVTRRGNSACAYYFLMNHEDECKDVVIPFDMQDLLNDRYISAENTIKISPKDVIILEHKL